jgi:hypothetical protein
MLGLPLAVQDVNIELDGSSADTDFHFQAHPWSLLLIDVVAVIRKSLLRGESWGEALRVYLVRKYPHGEADEPADEPSDEPADEPADEPSDEPSGEPSGEPVSAQADTRGDDQVCRVEKEVLAFAKSLKCPLRCSSFLRGGEELGESMAKYGISLIHVALIDRLVEAGPYNAMSAHERTFRALHLKMVPYADLLEAVDMFSRGEISFDNACQLVNSRSGFNSLKFEYSETAFRGNILHFGARP